MRFPAPVLLVGNGPVDTGAVELALPRCGTVVAADGGAEAALGYGLTLRATIGDMDSLGAADDLARFGEIIRIAAQDTTDFDKALGEIEAPLILAVGFLGGRMDHSLAALNTLVRSGRNVVLVGEEDIVFLLPDALELDLPQGTRISFFPMGPVAGVSSDGLEWELDGLPLDPAGMISISNRTRAARVTLYNPGQPLLCLLPREQLPATLKHFKF